MKRKHQRTLEQIYKRPTSGNIPWMDIEALFKALDADVSERAGSRVAVVLFGEVRVYFTGHIPLQIQIKEQLLVFASGLNYMR